MKAQLMLSMLLMLAVSMIFVLSIAALFTGVNRAYTSSAGSIGNYTTESDNALVRSVLPYSEFHIISNW